MFTFHVQLLTFEVEMVGVSSRLLAGIGKAKSEESKNKLLTQVPVR